jgi:hypothetical protein
LWDKETGKDDVVTLLTLKCNDDAQLVWRPTSSAIINRTQSVTLLVQSTRRLSFFLIDGTT